MFTKFVIFVPIALFLVSCHNESAKFKEMLGNIELEKIISLNPEMSNGTVEKNTAPIDKEIVNTPTTYKDFIEENVKFNVILAVSKYPEIKSQAFQREMAKSGVDMAKAAKEIQITGNLLTGAKAENSQTEASAVGNLSLGQVIYDYGSTDFAIASQKEAVRSAVLSEKIAVEKVALEAYKAWINLARSYEIERVFRRGIDLATPLLGQIRNISTSGIADKTGLLAAQQKFASLEIGYARTKSATVAAKAVFDDVFQSTGSIQVEALPPIRLDVKHKASENTFSNALDVQANESIEMSKSLEIKALEAASNPQVYFRANATLPAENIRDDGVATVGVDVSYLFNDGGFKKSQIEMLKFEIDSIRQQKSALILVKISTLKVLEQQYDLAIKRISSSEELLKLAAEVRETVKAQLVSGRSSIQDVMDAEVTFSETEIELINAKADAALASYEIFALTDSLSQHIEW